MAIEKLTNQKALNRLMKWSAKNRIGISEIVPIVKAMPIRVSPAPKVCINGNKKVFSVAKAIPPAKPISKKSRK